MKLLYRILLRMTCVLSLLLAAWAVLFYYTMIDEINDEVDDSLESRSELLMMRVLSGQSMPAEGWDANNTYSLREVAADYAVERPAVAYDDRELYIPDRGTEPARVLTTLFRDRENRWFELTVLTPSIEKDDLRQAIWRGVMALYGALLLTILVINGWLIYRTMRPLYALLRWLDAYNVGDKTPPPGNDAGITEFRKLNDAARRNAERSEQLFEQQKQFIGNASHEMQTPLAICRNRLEMLADTPSLGENQLEQIGRIQQTLDQLVRLNKSLLLLSKIENGQFPDAEQVDLGELADTLTADYQEIYATQAIRLEIHREGEFEVRMNPSLASVLVTNLLKNAYVHNQLQGVVRIEVTNEALRICNSAQNGSLDASRIFERFYQGVKKEGSTGLGLALAQAISRLYGLSLSYEWCDGMHCFSVRR